MSTVANPGQTQFTMQHIDEARLESDLPYRVWYLTEFIGITEDDWKAIHESGEVLGPVVNALVDAVYEKLWKYDATQRHFRRPGSGFKQPVQDDILAIDHPYIEFRKDRLRKYLVRLVSGVYDDKFALYLDWAGKIHTANAGAKEIEVPLVQMNALMGFVAAAVVSTLWDTVPEEAKRRRFIEAWNKVLWVQNDLINRHYAAQPCSCR
jgi:hypothetical protein